ncbi:glutathione S-transferase family protein [Biformimicrobium ophioploci]|uniref:Glutathione S-transferase family protein n=1 Tax=Biformimicrobium ophioploci TaxID=3036711 RepID=A0ABQ6LYE1_9GAMM|nr:glutathione S-transferase family protein [Microbulbifer sp. NKW57]GMG87103.1 glutathione S-transferase family protein [Microbulbifer sp. NKW57]
MGLLVKGEWHTDWYDTEASGGEFVREQAQFHGNIGDDTFPAVAGRYHLFVSLACPWAHRTLIFRKLKKLEDVIGVTVVKAEMLDNGWELGKAGELEGALEGAVPSPVEGIEYMHQLYTRHDPQYSGRVTVPVLWDKETNQIVCNESAKIIRILNSAFDSLTEVREDYYPEPSRDEIDEVNAFVYDAINNGVYKTGFATAQDVYEKHYRALFDALETLETRLGKQRYLVGDQITEADWRLFTTLIRFDSVYHGHFKCNQRQIESYPNLSNYLRDLYQQPGVAETVNFGHIKTHYYYSHDTINPTRIVPLGPDIDYGRAHDRRSL